MKLRSKFVAYMLLAASIPLVLAMSVALWQSTNQTRTQTIDIVQGYLDAGASDLSGFFNARKAEISAYARSPLLKSMDFESIRPFLVSELNRHSGIYEKFILGTDNGSFYNTAGGNPARGGLRTFDDTNPEAKLKTIARRDYWQRTVGDNNNRTNRVYVSNPMISYTTGAKQIVIAASILSDKGDVTGMIGGALPWANFEDTIFTIFDDIIKHQNWNSRFFLVTAEGVYWYHWDPANVVHFVKDRQGQYIYNDIGEKITSVTKITDEPIAELADAGKQMIAGKRGHTLFTDPQSGEEYHLVYAPVETAGFSVGLVVPENQMMAPVTSLQMMLGMILAVALLVVAIASWWLSTRVSQPITSLNNMVRAISNGDSRAGLIAQGNDEVAELTDSFNSMVNSITEREQSLKQSEERFSLAMQGANDGLWDWQLENDEVYFSPRWKAMLGYGEDEVANKVDAWKQLVHPDDLVKLTPQLDDFISGKSDRYEVEFRMLHKEGYWVDILSRGFAERDSSNRATRMVGTHTDISAHRKAEDEIRELNEKLEERVLQRTTELERAISSQQESEIRQRTILESVVDALITINERGIIESANPATESMFGYTMEQMVGNNVSMLMPEPHRHAHDGYLKNYHDTGESHVLGTTRELIAQRQDKTTFAIELSVSEMIIGDDKKYTGLIKDISDRKNFEKDLLKDASALTRLNAIAANPEYSFEEKMQQMLQLGLDTFELSLGIISQITGNTYTVEHVVGTGETPPPGTCFVLDETYCIHTYNANDATAFEHAETSEIGNHPCYRKFGLESYIGAPLVVDGKRYGTLNFSSPEKHERPFSDNERSLIMLLAQWIGIEISRSRSEKVLTQFKTTLDQTKDCVFMFEPASLKFFYANQGAMEQVGYSEAELLNMTPVHIKPEINETEFREMIAPLISGEEASMSFETIHQHKDGTRIPVEILLQHINPPGESPRFVAVVRDVSERHESTRKLNATIEEMAMRTKDITLLSGLADLLFSCHDVSEAYEVVTHYMPLLLPELSGALYIINENGSHLGKVGTWGANPPEDDIFLPQDCVAVRRGTEYTSIAGESALFCRHLPEDKPDVSICLPLAAQGNTFGLLHFEASEQAEGDKGVNIKESLRPEFSETIAKQVSMALASLRSKEQLENQSSRDPLTGLFNRRYMEDTFERELHRATRNGINIAFLMIDVDHFKKINDSYGHDAGDMVLRELGALLASKSRNEDIACRLGGEEFMLCLPGAAREIAETRAVEIREALQQLKLPYDGTDIGPITVSIGISIFPDLGNTSADLMKKADIALYRAKQNGRDRVVIAEPNNGTLQLIPNQTRK